MSNGNEKTYKTMGFAGVVGVVSGIVLACVGIALGVLLIVSGGKLLADRSDILF